MLRTRVLAAVWVLILAAVAAHAQSSDGFLAGGWGSCENLKEACQNLSANSLYYGYGSLGATNGHPSLGTCYLHDAYYPPGTTYPYKCWNYVKLSYNSGQKGYDGGTGCVGYTSTTTYADSQAQAAAILKQLCESGACCCPQVASNANCPSHTPVKRRDPITGSCCTFPDPCSAPSDWQVPSSADCQ